MIDNTVDKIKTKVQGNKSLSDSDKTDLLRMVTTLSSEVDELAKTHSEHAESIGRFAEISAHEAARDNMNPKLLQLSLDALVSSVDEFEVEHPRLVQAVNRICNILSNIGI